MKMTIKEFEEIANKNGYEKRGDELRYIRKTQNNSYIGVNSVCISDVWMNCVFFKNTRCEDGDFEVIKAAIALAETPFNKR